VIFAVYDSGHASFSVNHFYVQQSKTLRCFITRAIRKDIKALSP